MAQQVCRGVHEPPLGNRCPRSRCDGVGVRKGPPAPGPLGPSIEQTLGVAGVFPSAILKEVTLAVGFPRVEKGHRWGRAGSVRGGDVITQLSPNPVLSRTPL